MSFYRIYKYPERSAKLRHIYLYRDRLGTYERDNVQQNTKNIQDVLLDKERLSQSLSRTKRMIRDYILCNPFEYFCTFTFDGSVINRYDYNECKKKITNVFANYKKRYSNDFIYLLVPEFHKDGAIHFHGVIGGVRYEDFVIPDTVYCRDKRTGNLKEIKNKKKYVRWNYASSKLGFFDCGSIRKYPACANYVSKYITKDLAKFDLGKRLFLASHNLKKPELILDEDNMARPFFSDDERGSYFENEFCAIFDTNYSFGLLSGYDDAGKFYDVEFVEDVEVFEYSPLTIEELQLKF